jgi:hypothetical protein
MADNYRQARKRGLRAIDALAHVRNERTIADSDLGWTAEPDEDEPGHLTILLYDEDGNVIDALGGVDLPYWVSDHGNVHYDEHDPYVANIVAEMIVNA